jgi:hypothetical protein
MILWVPDFSCYNCGDCKIPSCGKVKFICNHRRVTMVETACENNDESRDSDSDTIDLLRKVGWMQV